WDLAGISAGIGAAIGLATFGVGLGIGKLGKSGKSVPTVNGRRTSSSSSSTTIAAQPMLFRGSGSGADNFTPPNLARSNATGSINLTTLPELPLLNIAKRLDAEGLANFSDLSVRTRTIASEVYWGNINLLRNDIAITKKAFGKFNDNYDQVVFQLKNKEAIHRYCRLFGSPTPYIPFSFLELKPLKDVYYGRNIYWL
ncbi:hypothetical protein, partial [Photobacterium minamisatsumaniensis]|uniref:hypothetical protein n=1 Tax=Photobacterium minamisatsumaniensis TaxID=2910233 RepID=UPI003D130C71